MKKFKPPMVIAKKSVNLEPTIKKDDKYYLVYFTRDTNKKRPKYQDGLLVWYEGERCSLLDMSGKEICKNKMKELFFDDDAEVNYVMLNRIRVEVDREISEDDYKSGKIFLGANLEEPKNKMKPRNNIKKVELPKFVQNTNQTNGLNNNTNPAINNQKLNLNTISQNSKTNNIFITTKGLKSPKSGLSEIIIQNEICDNYPVECYIDGFLAKAQRPHQKDGVKFLYECLVGKKGHNVEGSILADSMGLGKTIQIITLIWVLINQTPFKHENKQKNAIVSKKDSLVKKIVIVCPLSLVTNWQREFQKWLGDTRLSPLVASGDKITIVKTIKEYVKNHNKCIILSYETFTNNAKLFSKECDLLICDEGHRLKNMAVKSYQSLNAFTCKYKIIVTGTPIQNDLNEQYACVSFVCPKIFPDKKTFQRVFSQPITIALDKKCSEADKKISKARARELVNTINPFVLRRTGNILTQYLPPKNEYSVFIKMTNTQEFLYNKVIEKRRQLNSNIDNHNFGEVLSCITILRKILNHPKLVCFSESQYNKAVVSSFPSDFYDVDQCTYSSKFCFLDNFLRQIIEPEEKLILVSYWTTTLDIVAEYLESHFEEPMKYLRLDGSMNIKKRQRNIDIFNNPHSSQKIFLLCAKAGGTGLNLSVANRMIIFDADWNPSNDLQVMGRLWREGQKRTVHIYRLFCNGSVEENIYQRQANKANLSDNIIDDSEKEGKYDTDELKKICKKANMDCIYSFDDQSQNCFQKCIDEEIGGFNENMKDYVVYATLKITDESKTSNENVVIKNELEDLDDNLDTILYGNKEVMVEDQVKEREGQEKHLDENEFKEEMGSFIVYSDEEGVLPELDKEISNSPDRNYISENKRACKKKLVSTTSSYQEEHSMGKQFVVSDERNKQSPTFSDFFDENQF